MYTAQSAGAPTSKEPTLNDRLYGDVKNINDLCARIEEVLHRIAPRTQTPPVAQEGPKAIRGDGPPSMIQVLDLLREAVQRLERIAVEMPKIA